MGHSVVPSGLPVSLAGRPYLVDLTEYRRRTLPALRQPLDTSSEPGEQTLNTEGLWRRSQSDPSLGAGQVYFDEEGASRRRFYRSLGVDVWTEGELRLLNRVEVKKVSSAANLAVLDAGGKTYVASDTSLEFTADLTAPTPIFQAVNIHGGDAPEDVLSIDTDGAYVYAAVGASGLHRAAVGSTSGGEFAALPGCHLVGYVNGRLLAAAGPRLVEVGASGTTTDLYTHPNPDFVWTSLTGSPGGPYAAGKVGGRSEVYVIGVNRDTGALRVPVPAVALPDGETVNVVAAYAGLVILGTSLGLRIATVDAQSGFLSYGRAIEVPGGVTAVETQGRFVWFSWRGYPTPDELDPDATPYASGLGRADLGAPTATLVPAYATDLMVGSALGPVDAPVPSIASFDGGTRRCFALTGYGVMVEQDALVDRGWLTSGWIRFSTVEPKVAASIELRHAPLRGVVEAEIIDERGNATSVGTSNVYDSVGPTSPLDAQLLVGEQVQVRLTLSAADANAGPVLRRWTLRALATPARIDEIILPILLHSRVTNDVAGGQVYPYETLEEFAFLQSLVGTGRVVDYVEGETTYPVYVDRVEVQPFDWNDSRTFFDGTVLARLLVFDPDA